MTRLSGRLSSVRNRRLFLVAIGCAVVLFVFIFGYWRSTNEQVSTEAIADAESAHASPVSLDQSLVDATRSTRESQSSGYGELSYQLVLRELERNAAVADGSAFRRKAEIFESCFLRGVSAARKQIFAEEIARSPLPAHFTPSDRERQIAFAKLVDRRCEGVEGNAPISPDLIELNYRLAASRGDLSSKVRVDAMAGYWNDSLASEYARQALVQRDFSALLALSDVVDAASPILVMADGSAVSAGALVLYACERRPDLCGPTSPRVVNACLGRLECGASSYADIVRRYRLTPALAHSLPSQILAIRTGNY